MECQKPAKHQPAERNHGAQNMGKPLDKESQIPIPPLWVNSNGLSTAGRKHKNFRLRKGKNKCFMFLELFFPHFQHSHQLSEFMFTDNESNMFLQLKAVFLVKTYQKGKVIADSNWLYRMRRHSEIQFCFACDKIFKKKSDI